MTEELDTDTNARAWSNWLNRYGAEKFFKAFMRNAQGAISTCQNCRRPIALDIAEGGGVAEWGSFEPGDVGADYGCGDSPDTGPDGVGGHVPERADIQGWPQ